MHLLPASAGEGRGPLGLETPADASPCGSHKACSSDRAWPRSQDRVPDPAFPGTTTGGWEAFQKDHGLGTTVWLPLTSAWCLSNYWGPGPLSPGDTWPLGLVGAARVSPRPCAYTTPHGVLCLSHRRIAALSALLGWTVQDSLSVAWRAGELDREVPGGVPRAAQPRPVVSVCTHTYACTCTHTHTHAYVMQWLLVA